MLVIDRRKWPLSKVKEKLPDRVFIAEVTVVVGDDVKEVLVVGGVMIVVEDAVEEAVEEAFVADGDVCAAVDVSIGAVDVFFVIVCVVEVAILGVVTFGHGQATKFKQRA